MSLFKQNTILGLVRSLVGVLKSIFLKCTQALIIIQNVKWCHFLQTSMFCCEVRGQAQAVAACLCLHCLLLI